MNQKLTAQDVFHRIIHFIFCGLIVLGVYFIGMFVLNMFARGLFMPDEINETAFSFMGRYGWFILYALAYGLPLYFIYFLKDTGFKVFILHITEKEFNLKRIFKQFTVQFGKYDLLVYAAFSLLLLLPFKDPFDNPATLISISQMLFYMLPIPRIVSYLLAVVWFALQYYACLGFAAHYWDKHRLRPKDDSTAW